MIHKGIIDGQSHLAETILLSSLPTDGLIPSGTRTSAGRVMIKFRSWITWDWHMKGYKYQSDSTRKLHLFSSYCKGLQQQTLIKVFNCKLSLCLLWPLNMHFTHLPLDKMATKSQMIFSDAFSWMKSYVFWLKSHWSLFLRVQLTINWHWFR